ncbi:MAG: HNH endonuclease [Bacteroidetes bacterium]|nr:HNH endonuclease [Bacteroidota bacterium]
MRRDFAGEIWKEVKPDFDYVNDIKIEVSNFGRVRNTTSLIGLNYLKGHPSNGYHTVRIKLYKKRSVKDQNRLDFFREQIAKLEGEISRLNKINKQQKKKSGKTFDQRMVKIAELKDLRTLIKKEYRKELRRIELKRTINYNKLVHRLVAEYFVEKPSEEHFLVAHLNFDKKDNHASNLAWMTRAENVEHQKLSPYVITAKKAAFNQRYEGRKNFKLTTNKVMLIKKKLNKGFTQKSLAKKYNVSEMQISRIKRGENWAEIPAAR